MAHEVETMFYVDERKVPWHGLGKCIESAVTSEEAIQHAGLDWKVYKEPIYLNSIKPIEGYKATVRDLDQSVLGIVSDRYQVLQNNEAFDFTDNLISEGVTYETAGSLKDGKRIWLLAKLPEKYLIGEDQVESYIVFTNSHDGSSGIKVAITPIRVVCQNTLNLALNTAKRSWSTKHMGSLEKRLDDAKKTLTLAEKYMYQLKIEGDKVSRVPIPDKKVMDFLDFLVPIQDTASDLKKKNIIKFRNDFLMRYYEAPDLKGMPKNGWRFINAASDFATHTEPRRVTGSFRENLFYKTINGNPFIDKAWQLVESLK